MIILTGKKFKNVLSISSIKHRLSKTKDLFNCKNFSKIKNNINGK